MRFSANWNSFQPHHRTHCGVGVRSAWSLSMRRHQGRHAFPAQFEVVVQAATDQVQVRVVEAGMTQRP
jgi:hypothetical protein